MTQANGLITVRLHPTATENEEEFNAWYNLEHVPQVTALPGFVRTRRYFCDKSDIRYLAWYETDDESVEAGAHFQSIVTDPTPWSREPLAYCMSTTTRAAAPGSSAKPGLNWRA